MRSAEYENLLRHYHNALSTMVTKLGSDPAKLFTWDDLQGELKRFGLYGFLVGPLMAQVVMADASDIPNLDEYSEILANDSTQTNIFNDFADTAQKKYARRINGVLSDLVDFGYYWK